MSINQFDLLFSPQLIVDLADMRGNSWRELVKSILLLGNNSLEKTALVLMMARLVNCVTCNANSFRASQGCLFCSKQTLKRFHGTDSDLIRLYKNAQLDVDKYMQE